MTDALTAGVLFAGVAVLLFSTAGVLRMRDAPAALHFASAAPYGTLLIAIAIVLDEESFDLISLKALATAALLLGTSPVLAHITARAIRTRLEEAEAGERR